MVQLLGRSAELNRVRQLSAGLPLDGAVLVVVGEAGIGKTALLDAAVENAVARGGRVVKVTSTELESTLPYASLQQILHGLPGHLDAMRARPKSLLERAIGLLEGETPDALAVAVAFLESLTDAAPAGGLLLAVDDAQWLDEMTARVLAFSARRLDHDPVSVMFVLRSGYDSPLLRAGFDVMQIEPLSDEHSFELLGSRRSSLSGIQQTRVARSARGNPLALLELPPSYNQDDGTLAMRLRSAFLARLHNVSAESKMLLLAAALDDSYHLDDLQGVAQALRYDENTYQAALAELSASRTIDVRGRVFTFRHPLIRSAIVSSSSVEDRRRAHGALALALAGNDDRAVWHEAANASEPDERIAVQVEQVAERMQRRGNASSIVRALGISVRLSDDPELRAKRTIRMAEAALNAGQIDVAQQTLKRVDKNTLDALNRARWALVRLRADPRTSSPRELRSLLTDAHRLVTPNEIDVAVSLALMVGESLDAAGSDTRGELGGLARKIVDALPAGDIRGLVVLAATDRVSYGDDLVEAMLGLDSDEFSSAAELLTRLPPNVDANFSIARIQRRLLDTYRDRGQLHAIANLQPTHAWVEIALADWPEALRAIEEGSRLAKEIGHSRWAVSTLIGAAFISAVRGEHRAAEKMIEESERGAMAAGANNVLTGIQLTKGVNYAAQGRYDEAFTALKRPFDPLDPSYHPIQSGWSLGDLAEAAAHTGRIDEVRPLFERPRDSVTSPWQMMAELYAAPFLARTPEDVDGAFRAGLVGRVQNWPVYRVRLLIEYGAWLRRQWRVPEARDRLREGRDLADALTLRPWSERARTELRATGAESAPVEARAWEALSAQELEVAQLAAQGLSNREIGERLFLSHRTVGSHLYRIFPKLGISNRAQLAAALRSPS